MPKTVTELETALAQLAKELAEFQAEMDLRRDEFLELTPWIHQGSDGRDWTPDTNDADPIRSTLEWNYTDDGRRDELQLTNVDDLPANTKGVPFFLSGADTGAGETTGELKWALVDSAVYGTVQQSIEVAGNGATPSDYLLQLWDFDAAAGGSVPYSLTAFGVHSLVWQYPVSVSGDPILVTPYGAGTAVTDNMITDITSDGDEGDGVAWYYRSYRPITIQNGTISYGPEATDAEPLGLGLYVNFGSVNNTYKYHLNLEDVPQTYSSLVDHDARYIVKGSAYNTTGAQAYLESLGYGAGETGTPEKRIDLADCSVGWYPAGSYVATLDWADMQLKTGSVVCLSWGIVDGAEYLVTMSDGAKTVNCHVDGEIQGDDFKLHDAPSTNYWNGEGFGAYVTGNVFISSTAGTAELEGKDGVTLDAQSADITAEAGNVKLKPATNLEIWNGASYDTGATIAGLATKGILTNTDGWAAVDAQVMNPTTGALTNGKVLMLVD